MNPKGKPVLNEGLMLESAAYLAMWKALEAFDPKADRWSEPGDFGTREVRCQAADEALQKLQQQTVPLPTREDIARFRSFVSRLREAHGDFSEPAARFAEYLRDRGSELARQSVSHAGSATP